MKKLILALTIAVFMKPIFADEKATVSLLEMPSILQPKDIDVPSEAPDMIMPKAVPSLIETSAGTQPHGKRLWQFSLAAVAVSNVMDAHSSWGKRELNQTLAGGNGSFGVHSVLIKAGIAASVCTVEYLVLRRHPSASLYRKLSFINFGGASVTGAMAIRNYGVPRY